jgi:exodeoxyribonuclease III
VGGNAWNALGVRERWRESQRVCIVARQDFEAISVTPGPESAGALLKAEFGSWAMLACYFPQREAKAKYFDVSRMLSRDSRTRPLLIVGDLNTGNQESDRTRGGEKYIRAEDFNSLSRAEGLVDLWRLSNPARETEWTWLTSKNNFRIDHAFGNPSFVDLFHPLCRYDHSPRESRL